MSAKALSASALIAVSGLVLATSLVAQSENKIAFVHVANPGQRLRYLATARICGERTLLHVTTTVTRAARPYNNLKCD
jgi:hypothetical protein